PLTSTLFPYTTLFRSTSRKELEDYLHAVWKAHYSYEDEALTSLSQREDYVNRQGILRFDGNTARARNFIGFIQSEYESIEIYPRSEEHTSELQSRENL